MEFKSDTFVLIIVAFILGFMFAKIINIDIKIDTTLNNE